MFRSLSLLLVVMVTKKKEFGLKWPKSENTFFAHSHIQWHTKFDYDRYML